MWSSSVQRSLQPVNLAMSQVLSLLLPPALRKHIAHTRSIRRLMLNVCLRTEDFVVTWTLLLSRRTLTGWLGLYDLDYAIRHTH